jgi:hypothetical protein
MAKKRPGRVVAGISLQNEIIVSKTATSLSPHFLRSK